MSETQELKYTIEDHIGVMTLTRPPVNALGHELLAQIRETALQVTEDAGDGSLRVLVIRGEGKHFCAGADLKERIATPEDKVTDAVRHIGSSIRTVGDIPVPVIALVHGSAMGGGLELALAADIRVFADTAKAGLRETALAIIPGAGGTQRLPKLIGYSKALYWITSGHIFSAAEAHQQGVADFLVTEDELVAKGMELAKEIAANGPLAVQQAKKAVLTSFDVPLTEGLDSEFDLYSPLIPTEDRREGLKAFQEKRPPRYEGH